MSIEKLKRQIVCATLIQELGVLCNRSQEVIDVGIIYMHNIFVKLNQKKIQPIYVAAVSLFLSTKYQDKRIEMKLLVEKVLILGKLSPSKNLKIEYYITCLEHTVIGLFGTIMNMIHPNFFIKKVHNKYKFDDDFICSVSFICTSILHYTDFVIQYNSEYVAIIAIYIATKWNYIDLVKYDHKHWFQFIDPSIQTTKIIDLSHHFLKVFKEIPNNLKVIAFEQKVKENSSMLANNNINNNNNQNPKKRKIISKDEYTKRSQETNYSNYRAVEHKTKTNSTISSSSQFHPQKRSDLNRPESKLELTPESYMDF